MHRIPKSMSTQHPDNVAAPFFCENTLLDGQDEVQEAYYAFSHLGCDEQMWDFEGKEVDNFVVKKLLTKNENYFKRTKLGKDVFLTFRVPNPAVERAEGKILLETLESIPRSYDAAKLFYGEDIAPVFEVILPMTTDASALNRMYHYYQDFVAGKQNKAIRVHDISIAEWLGEFHPEKINVIPLFEDMEHMLAADQIVREYLKDKEVPYQRVFLARSDPAANYGSLSAVLLNKIALQRLHKLSQERGIPIYPILGVGSAPFRGNFRPDTVESVMNGYPSVHTYTIQSSFKFDHPADAVRDAVAKIHEHETSAPMAIDEERALDIMKRYSTEYARQIRILAPAINRIAPFIPKRRKRKLHIGLFGYARNVADLKLPRAITFTASLYSLGIPPELLGMNALTAEDTTFLKQIYTNFEFDLTDPLRFANFSSPFFPEEIKTAVRSMETECHAGHREVTSAIVEQLERMSGDNLSQLILRAAHMRGFLG